MPRKPPPPPTKSALFSDPLVRSAHHSRCLLDSSTRTICSILGGSCLRTSRLMRRRRWGFRRAWSSEIWGGAVRAAWCGSV